MFVVYVYAFSSRYHINVAFLILTGNISIVVSLCDLCSRISVFYTFKKKQFEKDSVYQVTNHIVLGEIPNM